MLKKTLVVVLVRVTTATMKHKTKRKLERKGVYLVCIFKSLFIVIFYL